MRKVLILAYDFPPYVSVGGLRPYNWFKYLKEYGVEPIIVTRQWSNKYGNELDYVAPGSSSEIIIEKTEHGTIIRTPYHPNLSNRLLLKHGANKYRLLRKGISAIYEIAQFIVPIGPKAGIYRAARRFLKHNNVDLIIATGEPFVLFKYAAKLSRKNSIPWIADYRDPWSQNVTRKSFPLSRLWNRLLEKSIVSSAFQIITVSNQIKCQIQKLFKTKHIDILQNGFDPELLDENTIIPKNKRIISIAFVGSLYKWHPIRQFLYSLNTFLVIHPHRNIELVFYGTNKAEEISKMVESLYPSLRNRIIIEKKRPNNDLITALSEHHAFLLFNDYYISGTKIYDYLALRRKILFCFRNEVEAKKLRKKYYHVENLEEEESFPQQEIIQKTNSGIVIEDSEHLLKVLDELYAEFEVTGTIACNSVGIEQYSRKVQVKRLAEIIQNI